MAEPVFRVGQKVRVLDLDRPGHVRTPFYIRGRTGEVERICGAFANPEGLSKMRDGLPKQPLYRVRFRQRDVWPDYAGPAADVVEVEIYEHWLQAA